LKEGFGNEIFIWFYVFLEEKKIEKKKMEDQKKNETLSKDNNSPKKI
jgi:hypothetical protein